MRLTMHEYTVAGTWPFPTDMLRYDDASPATPEDAEKIARLSSPDAASLDDLRHREQINLRGPRRPTERRWESFLWTVVRGA